MTRAGARGPATHLPARFVPASGAERGSMRTARGAREGLAALAHAHIADTAVLRDHQLENEVRRAVRALGVGTGSAATCVGATTSGFLCPCPRRYQAEPTGHADPTANRPNFPSFIPVAHPTVRTLEHP